MGLAGGRDGDRALVDQVVHDREVVGGQVPDHVHVVLEEAQVDAHRVVVVELAEGPSSMSCLIFLTAPVKRKVWSTMIVEVLLRGELDQLLGLGGGGGEGLLDEDVLAVLQGLLGQFEVGRDRRDDRDGVDLRRFQDLLQSVVSDAVGQVILTRARDVRVLVADGHDAPLRDVEVPDDVRAPIPVADDADLSPRFQCEAGFRNLLVHQAAPFIGLQAVLHSDGSEHLFETKSKR